MQMAKVSAALARLDRAGVPVHLGADGPDDRWRHRQLCDARRSEHRGAEGAHRFRRSARHRADDPAEAAGRIPAQRVSGGARHAGPGSGSPRVEGHHRARAPVHECRFRRGRHDGSCRGFRGSSRPSIAPAPLLDRLFALETFGIKLGLENISTLCAALGHPERSFLTLHVAGTNGKGSVAAMVHAALVAGGFRAARYTSPHLSRPHRAFRRSATRPVEHRRARADGRESARLRRPAADERASCACRRRSSKRQPPPRSSCSATAASRWRVIEVGLGGRFDATNVITPAVGAITTIGYDHQQYLGDTLEEIAFEKAGIIKPGMTVVDRHAAARARTTSSAAVAADRGATVIDAPASDAQVGSEMRDGAARISIATPAVTYGPVTLGLRGSAPDGQRTGRGADARSQFATRGVTSDARGRRDWTRAVRTGRPASSSSS